MKLPRFIFITIYAIFSLFLLGCAENEQDAYNIDDKIMETSDEEIIDNLSNESAGIRDNSIHPIFTRPANPALFLQYAAEAAIGNRRYLFPTDNEHQNISFIKHIEEMITEIENIVAISKLHSVINIPFFDFEESKDFIRLLNILSDNQFPFWLSFGIEALASTSAEQMHLSYDRISENFGDLSFSPHLRGSDAYNTAVNTSINFVKFLMDNMLLDELAELYTMKGTKTANETARAHFQDFAGKPMSDLDFRLELRNDGGYYIKKSGEWGNFTFVFDTFQQNMLASTMQHQIDNIERATEFVVNWYSEHLEFNFVPINHRIYPVESIVFENVEGVFAAIAYAHENSISYARLNALYPLTAPHEVSHIIEYRIRGQAFLPFAEGHAYLLMYYFSGVNLGELGFPRDHISAYNLLTSGEYKSVSDIRWDYNQHHIYYFPELSARTTATSFVQYLIETYGAEKYFQVHWMVENFEPVFGITIEEMILRWREFLEEYVAAS